MESVSPSRVADALPLPVMMGCVASLNGMADKYTWYFSAAVSDAKDRTAISTARLFLLRMGPHPHALPSLTLRILVVSFVCFVSIGYSNYSTVRLGSPNTYTPCPIVGR